MNTNKKRGDTLVIFDILLFILLALFALIGYNLLKIFVLDKIKLNKWVIFAIGIILVALSSFLQTKVHQYVALFFVALSVIPFLWFFNILRENKSEKKRTIKIKPKAKPNRVKNNNK